MLRLDGRVPARLREQPLVEAIFEVRFDPSPKTVAELTPGMLYTRLGTEYPDSELQPLGNLPRELREGDEKLWYLHSHRLVGPEGVILIGDRVLGVAKTHPYRGWAEFRGRIEQFLTAVRETNLIEQIARCSMKSVNVLPAPTGSQLARIRGNFTLGEHATPETGFRLRTEYRDGSEVLVVQIHTNAKVTIKGGEPRAGILIDLDHIMNFEPSRRLWDDPLALVDSLHSTTKSAFFALLTPETLDSLGPEY